MANTITYLSTDYQTLTNGQVSGTTKVWFAYDGNALTCVQVEAGFGGLTENQIIAKRADCLATAPATPAGQIVVLRDCSPATPDPVTPPTNPTTPGTPTDEEPAITVDLTDEDNVKFYNPS